MENMPLFQDMFKLISRDIYKLVKTMNEIHGIDLEEMIEIWCKQENIERTRFMEAVNDDEDTPTISEPKPASPVSKPSKPKPAKNKPVLLKCNHKFVNGDKKDTLCGISIKGEGDKCSKHKIKPKPDISKLILSPAEVAAAHQQRIALQAAEAAEAAAADDDEPEDPTE